jgi:G3E family GTPase
LPIAATFSFRDEAGAALCDIARLDTMVSVVDAVNLMTDYTSTDLLSDRGETRADDDKRTLVDLLVEQIEFADVVVINKISEVMPETRDALRRIVAALNPDARVIETDFGHLPLSAILDTGLFSEAKSARHPLWHKELYGWGDHVPETEEYGISSFVYDARQPFDPSKLQEFLGRKWPGLIRAKGHFWLATRPDWIGLLSIAGAQHRIESKGHVVGDRFQERIGLVTRNSLRCWIGTGVPSGVIAGRSLSSSDRALPKRPSARRLMIALSDPTMASIRGIAHDLHDPFPPWEHAHAA